MNDDARRYIIRAPCSKSKDSRAAARIQRQNELALSRDILEKPLGEPIWSLGHPNGDFDEPVMRETKAAGYTMDFTTHRSLFGPGNDTCTLPRQNIHEGKSSSESLIIYRCLTPF